MVGQKPEVVRSRLYLEKIRYLYFNYEDAFDKAFDMDYQIC